MAPLEESNARPVASKSHTTSGIVTLLGTAGGPVVDPARSQPATLLEIQGKRILIDCGEGTVVQLAKLGLKASDIDMVFLTHLHFDHTAGLPSLFAFSSIGTIKGISVYGPPGTDEVVADSLNANRVSFDLFNVYRKPPVDRSALAVSHMVDVASSPEVIYSTSGLSVLAVDNSHYGSDTSTYSYGRPKSYSYRFELPDRSIVFTGDTGPSPAVTRLADKATVLISEVINLEAAREDAQRTGLGADTIQRIIDHHTREHLTPEAVGELAQSAGVRRVVLNHLAYSGKRSESNMMVRRIRRVYQGQVEVGKDLARY